MSEIMSEKAIVADSGSSTAKIYGVVLSVGVVCSLAIVSTYELTRPIIQQNKLALRQRAILDVLPDAVTSEAFRFDESSGEFQLAESSSEDADLVFAGFSESGELIGLAIAARAMGYQDYIQLLYGYSPEKQAIIGIQVLESRETPGLGDRIETDPEFTKNFERLDVRVGPDGKQLANPIEFVKPGEKTEDWQIDGITGATISSQATAEMLRESSKVWMPRIQSRLNDFRSAEAKQVF